MAYNYSGYTDVGASVLPALVKTITGGETNTSKWTTSDYINVARKTLVTDTDLVISAISQTIGDTIFDIDAYSGDFSLIEKDKTMYGNLERLIKFYDDVPSYKDLALDFTNNIGEGKSGADPWKMDNMQTNLQLNLQGSVSFAQHKPFDYHGLEVAFKDAEEMGRYWSGCAQVMKNSLEMDKTALRRATVLNFIGGIIAPTELSTASFGKDRVINLLEEYNRLVNPSTWYTVQTIFAPNVFPDFAKYVVARIKEVANDFEKSTIMYQTNIYNSANRSYTQNTPKSRQRLFILDKFLMQCDTRVLADTFNPSYLGIDGVEHVTYWQNPQKKSDINVNATYLKTDGTVATANVSYTDSSTAMIVGCLFDEKAMACAQTYGRVLSSGLNAATEHYVLWAHEIMKYFNDFTQKGCVFILKNVTQPSA